MDSSADAPGLKVRKASLREAMLEARGRVSEEEMRRVGDRLCRHLLDSLAFRQSRRVALYAAQGGEPDLRLFFDQALALGKEVLLPRCGAGHRLVFHRIESWSELKPGRYGLLEPQASASEYGPEALDLVLVPSLAVDLEGRRLGRGGGWYDRALAARQVSADSHWLAVIHDFQRVKTDVPAGKMDQRVDGFVTEEGIFWCGD